MIEVSAICLIHSGRVWMTKGSSICRNLAPGVKASVTLSAFYILHVKVDGLKPIASVIEPLWGLLVIR